MHTFTTKSILHLSYTFAGCRLQNYISNILTKFISENKINILDYKIGP